MSEKLICKIQVLLTPSEFEDLNRIILNQAIIGKTRPKSMSLFIRELIIKCISENPPEQRSFAKDAVKKLIGEKKSIKK